MNSAGFIRTLAGSLMNTPPVFAVYVSMLTLKWIEDEGGLKEMSIRSAERATLLYNTLDSLPLFKSNIAKKDRSEMNAVFFIEDENLQNLFLEECKQAGFIGVKGYRTVGGVRVSMYNALPLSSVIAITDLMQSFAAKHS
jgi:phosphoserine aminotransferase